MRSKVYIYVAENLDGVIAVPLDPIEGTRQFTTWSKKRVFVSGGPFKTLTDPQKRALALICLRSPTFPVGVKQVVFVDGVRWARTERKYSVGSFRV